MNVNDVKQLKQHYETQLQSKLAQLLSLQPQSINVDWSLEKTVVAVATSQQNTFVDFVFEYDGTEFTIHSSAYQVATRNNMPIGVVVNTATINLNTIHAIFDTIVEVISSSINEDQCDAAESSEG